MIWFIDHFYFYHTKCWMSQGFQSQSIIIFIQSFLEISNYTMIMEQMDGHCLFPIKSVGPVSTKSLHIDNNLKKKKIEIKNIFQEKMKSNIFLGIQWSSLTNYVIYTGLYYDWENTSSTMKKMNRKIKIILKKTNILVVNFYWMFGD